MVKSGNKVLLLLGIVIAIAVTGYADDVQARAKIMDAQKYEESGDFRAAAKAYDDAAFLAEDGVIRMNSLKKSAANFRNCGLIYQEFKALEQLLSRYPGDSDTIDIINRIYEIGDEFHRGKREPSFWALRWIPWLKDPDKSLEVYSTALKYAPFAPQAARTQFQLALLLGADGKTDEAIDNLRAVIRNYPGAPEEKNAYLLLAEVYYERSLRGDGDGMKNQEAMALFAEIRSKYPNAPELDRIDKLELKSRDARAERLLGLAEFYRRTGRSTAAERYLSEVVRNYPDSPAAPRSEELLVRLDKTYIPDQILPEPEPRTQEVDVAGLPVESSELLIVPENSGGKYLLPIYDLKGGKAAQPEKKK